MSASATLVSAAASPADFLGSLEAALASARLRAGTEVHDLSLAGVHVRLELVRSRLADWLLPALRHAARPLAAGAPDATIAVWDCAGTGTPPPPPAWPAAAFQERGEIAGLSDARYRAAYQEHAGVFAMWDGHERRCVVWARDAGLLPRYERAAPLRGPLSWVLGAAGAQLAHAAAVATDDGAALLAGAGGAGKSTTAALCLADGLAYLGDDYVAVSSNGGRVDVHALYATAKLTPDALARLPRFAALADGPGTADDKAMALLHPAFPAAQLPASRRARAVLLPRVTSARDTRWAPASQAQALQALAPTTLLQLPGAGREAFARLAAIARALPAYTLALGTDLTQVPDAVRACLADAAGRSR